MIYENGSAYIEENTCNIELQQIHACNNYFISTLVLKVNLKFCWEFYQLFTI